MTREPEPPDGRPDAAATVVVPSGSDDGSTSDPPRRHQPRRRWTIAASILFGLIVAGVVTGAVVRVKYVIVSPGDATPVSDVVTVKGAPTYSHRGALLFLTVSVSQDRPSFWRFAAASVDDDAQVLSEHDYYGPTTRAQDRKANVQAMDRSQDVATKVALEKLGYTVPVTGTGAIVADVRPNAPAAGNLRVGDVITAVDGQAVMLADQVGPLVRSRAPGAPVTLTVERSTGPRTVTITTAAAPTEPNRGQAYLGVVPATRDLRYHFPVDVTIDPGPVSGPSAGLSFTLTILDEMTPGNLTGGRRIAVTGEILPDGSVGEVGGVAQKTVAARDAGARLMLVPASELAGTRGRAGSMRVVGVRTLDDALAALRAAGGAPLEASAARAA